MNKVVTVVFLSLLMFPMVSSFSQTSDTNPTIALQFTTFSPFYYKADDGSTIVIGEVENIKSFPLTGVKIRVNFYDDNNPQPLESAVGTTILEVIPPMSKSPYIIKSPSPNSAITNVSVSIQGFNSAGPKQTGLDVEAGPLTVSERLQFSGKLVNNGQAPTGKAIVNLVFYDSFEPPRLIGIESATIPDVAIGSSAGFDFDVKRNPNAAGFKIMVDSANFYPIISDVQITPPEIISKLVTIQDVTMHDKVGNRLSDAIAGRPILLQSNLNIQFSQSSQTPNQSYVYYTQVKQSGEKAFVEFLGSSEGTFRGQESHAPNVEWIPEKPGLYFVETFVWDSVGIPIASKGPIILILVN